MRGSLILMLTGLAVLAELVGARTMRWVCLVCTGLALLAELRAYRAYRRRVR